ERKARGAAAGGLDATRAARLPDARPSGGFPNRRRGAALDRREPYGIEDPLWVRLFFVLITVSGGFGIPLYLILWAVLPKAETASDRLAMRGEKANVSNIGKIIEDEFTHMSKKMSELGEELKAEFSSKKKAPRRRTTLKKKAAPPMAGFISEQPLPRGFMF
ncbi:MAG: PspC domain-containing protein, partial [Saprospiraceae bacterium]